MNIELTKEEANALIQLLDVAIKAGGYQNAKPGVYLVDKILAELSKETKPTE